MKKALMALCWLVSSSLFAETEKATFGGGCFWCMEPPFESLHGVSSVVSGYSGGSIPNPTYAQVTTGETGHIDRIYIGVHWSCSSPDDSPRLGKTLGQARFQSRLAHRKFAK